MFNMTRICMVLLGSIFLQIVTSAQDLKKSVRITGVVYADKNGNGRKDADESGIANVVVSDQLNVAVTDASGVYHLDHGAAYPFIFVSIPSGFTSKYPFWQGASDSTKNEINFPL